MTNVLTLGAPLLLLAYYLVVFFALGHDPAPEIVAPQYEPPKDFSPAAVRLLWRCVADARSVAAIFADLCSRRLIAIEKSGSKYKIKRLYSQPTPLPELPHEENTVLDFLFSNFYDHTEFDPTRQAPGCASVVLAVLNKTMQGRYVTAHARYIAFGVVGSAAAAALLLSTKPGSGRLNYLIVSVFLAFLTLLGPILTQVVLPLVRDIRQGTWSLGRIFLAIVLMGFFASWFVLLGMKLRGDYPWSVINAIFAMAVLNVIVQPFLRRDTDEGKRLKQHIEGFRMFLLAVEQDQLDRMNPPKQEIQYAANLAYAIALEVKEAWGDHLTNELYPSLS